MKKAHGKGSVLVAIALGALSAAPTPGDVGGCGTEPTALDTAAYVLARKDQDCERCQECGIGSQRCVRACTPAAAPDTNVPGTCRPLRHDGEVCLRALAAASCEDYAGYVADFAPATPTECQFCKEVPQGGVPALVFDAGGPAEGGAP